MSSNEQHIRNGYAAFAAGDLDALREMLAPDAVWHVPGRSATAGTYVGADAILGYFVTVFERSGGTFRADLEACGEIAPGLVAAQARVSGTMPGGAGEVSMVQLFRVVDGRTTEVRAYAEDQYAVDAMDPAPAITLPDARTPMATAPPTLT